MSRLSFEEMRVFVTPGRLGLARVRRGMSGRALESASVPVVGDSVDAMAGQLRGKAIPVRIYLSNHYVRLMMLPWQEALETDEEWQAFARHAFDAAFGVQDGRRIRIALQGYGQKVVAAALDEPMHAAIQVAVEAGGNRLQSLEPWCIAALDQHRRALARDCWFFAAEPGMIASMKIEGGILTTVSMHPLGMNWDDGMAEAMVREMAKHGDGEALPVFLHATAPVRLSSDAVAGKPIKVLAAGRDVSLGMVS